MLSARAVLASAAHGTVQHVADAVGVSRPIVWRWQQRFSEAGVEVFRDKTGRPDTRY
jgi:transposase